MPPGLTIADAPAVRDRYYEFWTRLNTAIPEAQTVNLGTFRVTRSPLAPDCLDVEIDPHDPTLRFDEVPTSPRRPTGQKCEILIQLRQTVSRSAGTSGSAFQLVHSVVRVAYLDKRRAPPAGPGSAPRGQQVIAGFHFDLGLDQQFSRQPAHPIYHAQIDFDCIVKPGSSRRCTACGRNVRVTSRFPRIPTAPLDLAGVVFLVLNDHFPSRVAAGWPPELASAASKLPRLPRLRTTGTRSPDGELDVVSWYRA